MLHAKPLSFEQSVLTCDMQDPPQSSYTDDLARTLAWVAGSVGFGCAVGAVKGLDSGVEFMSGYVLEQTLSVDNLFVFLLLFEYFQVPFQFQPRVLKWGILGAIVMRGLFVSLGAATLQSFKPVLLLFAAVLAASSVKILATPDDAEEQDPSQNLVVKTAQKYLQTSDHFDGDKFFTYVNGVKLATPLLLCLICVEMSDVVFAVDSVPAVFGVTQDPLIVYTSNIFAIASLRSLYGVLSRAVGDLVYLEKAVGVVLGFIGVKLILEFVGYDISALTSLGVVVSVLGAGVVASKMKAQEQD